MATKRGRRSTTKKVQSLKAKDVSAGKAKGVRGGALGLKEGATQKIQDSRIKVS